MKALSLLTLILSFPVLAEIHQPWKPSSNPVRMSRNFQKKFSDLPMVGQAVGGEKYWSSHYWPLNQGNINFRWNSTMPTGFNLNSPDKLRAKKMTQKQLKELAPTEKFDLYLGNYDYPVKQDVGLRASPTRRDWEGICHGWAAAALNHNEPTAKVLKNPDGIRVPFGSSDIKALLSYYYAYKYDPVSTHQMGRRCRLKRNCQQDLNAGAFHIVLSNKLGIEGSSFIADIERGREVWNQVVYSYVTRVIEPELRPARDSAKGTVKVVRVSTLMRVVFNIVKNSWLPVRNTALQTYKDENYEYDLDINKHGEIIGGKWRSLARPDFLWTVAPEDKFTGLFERLPELLNKR